MLANATTGQAPDLVTTWAAFSGVLTQATIDTADWKKTEGATKKKVPGPRSVNVFNIDAFQGAVAKAPPTPIQHAVFQLTDVKVICQPTPDGYEAPVDPSNFLLPWATGGRGKKRKRTRYDGDDALMAAMLPLRTTTTRKRKRMATSAARSRHRTEKSVSRVLWPLEARVHISGFPRFDG